MVVPGRVVQPGSGCLALRLEAGVYRTGVRLREVAHDAADEARCRGREAGSLLPDRARLQLGGLVARDGGDAARVGAGRWPGDEGCAVYIVLPFLDSRCRFIV
jgi:hypothetical protein